MVMPQNIRLDTHYKEPDDEDEEAGLVEGGGGGDTEDDGSEYIAGAESPLDDDDDDDEARHFVAEDGKSLGKKDVRGGTKRTNRKKPALENQNDPQIEQKEQQQQLRQSKRRRKKRRRYYESSDEDGDDQEEAATVRARSSSRKRKKKKPTVTTPPTVSQKLVAKQRGAPAPDFEDDEEEDDDDIMIPSSQAKAIARKLERFDVSSLLPLTRPDRTSAPTSPPTKTRIELICKLTGSIHVCFPSIDYAAQALGTTRKAVRRACRRFGTSLVTPIVEELESSFATCHLRHVAESSAYEYGAHARDFLLCDETHEERLERWAKLQEATNDPLVASLMDDEDEEEDAEDRDFVKTGPSNTSAASADASPPRSHNTRADKRSPHSSIEEDRKKRRQDQRKKAAHEAHVLGLLEGATLWEQTSKGEDETKPRIDRHNERAFMSFCVACQVKQAVIVLEPCHHCILCRECASQSCPSFCPKCMTKIRGRLHPQMGVCVIEPGFFSGRSFF